MVLTPFLEISGVLSLCHISIDVPQYKLVRGLLGYNLGECVDDLNDLEAVAAAAIASAASVTSPGGTYGDQEEEELWTGMFMNIELHDVILDLMTSSSTCMARVNLIKSRLIYESFSDSSR